MPSSIAPGESIEFELTFPEGCEKSIGVEGAETFTLAIIATPPELPRISPWSISSLAAANTSPRFCKRLWVGLVFAIETSDLNLKPSFLSVEFMDLNHKASVSSELNP
jgi:hypothetical protein